MANRTMKKTTTVAESGVVEQTNKQTKREFKADDGILCRAVVHGKTFVNGLKSGMKYIFADYDGEAEIEYRDLVALVRARDKAIYKPRIVILDQDFINEFPTIKKFYDEHYNIMNLKEILDMPDYQMKEEISKLPEGAAKSLKSIAAQYIIDGTIDSVKKIKALDEVFGTELSLLNELLSD